MADVLAFARGLSLPNGCLSIVPLQRVPADRQRRKQVCRETKVGGLNNLCKTACPL